MGSRLKDISEKEDERRWQQSFKDRQRRFTITAFNELHFGASFNVTIDTSVVREPQKVDNHIKRNKKNLFWGY